MIRFDVVRKRILFEIRKEERKRKKGRKKGSKGREEREGGGLERFIGKG